MVDFRHTKTFIIPGMSVSAILDSKSGKMTRHDVDIGMHTIGIRSTAPFTYIRLSLRSERRHLIITM